LTPPILIAGAPRSGTSLTAGLLAAHGVAVGHHNVSATHNRKGVFENGGLRRLMAEVLAENGHDTHPLIWGWPKTLQSSPPWRKRVVMASDIRGTPWLVKEQRILMTAPLWQAAWPDALWVFPRRDVEATVRSFARSRLPLARLTANQAREWVALVWQRQTELARTVRHVWVDSDKLARGDMGEAAALVTACGLDFDSSIARDWIEPEMWRA